MRTWAVVAAAVVLGLAGSAGGATSTPDELVFASTRAPDFHHEVFVIDTRTGSRRNVSRSPTADRQPVLSPDRRTIAFISDRGGLGEAVWVTPASGGPLRRLHTPQPGIEYVQWSPDGRRLAFAGANAGMYVVARAGSGARRLGKGILGAPVWVTSGTIAAFESGGLVVRNLEGHVLWRRPASIHGVSARGDLALGTNDGRLEIVSSGGRVRASVPGGGSAVWSRDGARLAYVLTSNAGIGIVERTGAHRVLGGSYSHVVGWSADGRSVLAYETRPFRTVQVSLTGKVTPVPLERGVWSPAGAALIGSDPRGRLAVWRPGSEPRPLQPPPARESCRPWFDSTAWLDDGHVVVQLGRGGMYDADLWTASRTGARLRRVVRSVDWAAAPEWSPDGKRIVYESGRVQTDGGICQGPLAPHLRTAGADGTGDRALTPHSASHSQQGPRWSPDGTRVAFHRTDSNDPNESGVFVVDIATQSMRRLTTGYGEGVSWSPDGRRVMFSGGGVSVADLGTGRVNRIGPGERAEWSPDGSLIAHVRNGDVWVMSPDGAEARRLVDAKVVGDLRWSRDGSLLAFGFRGGVRIVRRDGRVVRTIAQPANPMQPPSPTFSRDGRLVAFVAAAGSPRSQLWHRSDLYVADVAGGPARRVTRDYAGVGAPSWR